MVDDKNIVSLQAAKAKAAGISTELASVIEQLNARFNIRIELTDERLERFKSWFPTLDEAAKQHHHFEMKNASTEVKDAFKQGVEVGKAQMMTDVIICILEQDGLIKRDQ
jgi:hypothetical protein